VLIESHTNSEAKTMARPPLWRWNFDASGATTLALRFKIVRCRQVSLSTAQHPFEALCSAHPARRPTGILSCAVVIVLADLALAMDRGQGNDNSWCCGNCLARSCIRLAPAWKASLVSITCSPCAPTETQSMFASPSVVEDEPDELIAGNAHATVPGEFAFLVIAGSVLRVAAQGNTANTIASLTVDAERSTIGPR